MPSGWSRGESSALLVSRFWQLARLESQHGDKGGAAPVFASFKVRMLKRRRHWRLTMFRIFGFISTEATVVSTEIADASATR